MTCFDEGSQAFQANKSTADNPYSKGSEEGVEWQRGYDDAAMRPRLRKPKGLAASLAVLLLFTTGAIGQDTLALSKKPSTEQVATAKETIKAAQQAPTALAYGGYAIIDIKLEGKLTNYVVPGSDDCIKTIYLPKGQGYQGWLVSKGDNVARWTVIDPIATHDRLLISGVSNGTTTLIWMTVQNNEAVVVAAFQFVVGNPRPPPSPVDPDPPKPVDPIINYTGLRVVFVYEQSAKLTQEQINILGSAKISAYLNAKCAKDEKGRPAWRKWDKDVTTTSLETQSWRDLWATLKPKLGTLPQICIITDQKGETFQLPDTEQKTLDLLQKYGGK